MAPRRFARDYPRLQLRRSRLAIDLAPLDGPAHAHLAPAFEEEGETAEAIKALRNASRLMPDSPIVAYHLVQLARCAAPARCPPEYLIPLFDDYAPRFEQDLIHRLSYRAPELMARAIHREQPVASSLDVLDLGCGTGLCGQAMKPIARHLTGV